jgi:hypothetical protein
MTPSPAKLPSQIPNRELINQILRKPIQIETVWLLDPYLPLTSTLKLKVPEELLEGV